MPPWTIPNGFTIHGTASTLSPSTDSGSLEQLRAKKFGESKAVPRGDSRYVRGGCDHSGNNDESRRDRRNQPSSSSSEFGRAKHITATDIAHTPRRVNHIARSDRAATCVDVHRRSAESDVSRKSAHDRPTGGEVGEHTQPAEFRTAHHLRGRDPLLRVVLLETIPNRVSGAAFGNRATSAARDCRSLPVATGFTCSLLADSFEYKLESNRSSRRCDLWN